MGMDYSYIIINNILMKKITIAFDVDGTIISNLWNPTSDNLDDIKENERIVNLLITLSSFKNTKIIVWSWRWAEWAETICNEIEITKYVDWYASKNHIWKDSNWKHQFNPDIIPDICIDDIQACELWVLNLIVKEK